LTWRGGKIGAETMMSIPSDKYQPWSQGENINPADVLSLIGADTGIGWPEVVQMMIDFGITPSCAVDIIQDWREIQKAK